MKGCDGGRGGVQGKRSRKRKGGAAGRQRDVEDDKKRYDVWEKKNGKRQLVWRLEEKLGSDTEESFMHCPHRTVQSDEGLVRQGKDMENWDGVDCAHEMVHT